jgi:hypothetical protein
MSDLISEIQVLPIDGTEKCTVMVDADSVYFCYHDLLELVGAIGTACQYSLNSLHGRYSSSKKSRFGVDCSRLTSESPLMYRGYPAQKINLEQFPNMRFCDCGLNHIPNHTLVISLHYLGGDYVRKTNFFTHEEMAVINIAMNLTRRQCLSFDDVSSRVHVDLRNLPKFETKVGGPKNNHMIQGYNMHLGPAAMGQFAKMLMATFKKMGEGTIELPIVSECTGMCFADDGKGLDEELVKRFARKLYYGLLFSASCAGFKDVYRRPRYSFRVPDDVIDGRFRTESLMPLIQERVDLVVEHLQTKVFKGARSEMIDYHFDIGVQIVPDQIYHESADTNSDSDDDESADYYYPSFVVKGKDTCRVLRQMLNLRLVTNSKPCPKFDYCFLKVFQSFNSL